jgi:hypothetical protein
MKTCPITLESNLIMKSTAELREEIISELTMPDKSLSSLIKDIEDQDNHETKDESNLCD